MSEKRVIYDATGILSNEDDDLLYVLTKQEASFLLTPMTNAEWNTRWTNIPQGFDYSAFVGQVNERLMMPVDICQLVADCINNDPSTITAIQNILNEQNLPNNSGSNTVGAGDGNILDGVSCDLDTIYGVAINVEATLHAACIDFLELIVDADGIGEWIVRFVDYFPFLGDLPFLDDLNDMYEHVSEEGLQSYEAGYTTAIQQDLECRIFLKGCADCELLPSEVVEAISDAAGGSISLGSAMDLVISLVAGTVGNEQFVYGMQILAATALSIGGSLGGLVGLNTLQVIALQATPSSAHTLLCDPCGTTPGWAYYIDFTTELGLFTVHDGVWIDGVGIESVVIGGKENAAALIEFDAPYIPHRISVDYERTTAGSFDDDIRIVQWTDISVLSGRFDWLERDDTTTGIIQFCPPAPAAGANRLQISFHVRDNNAGSKITIKGIKIFHLTETTPPSPLIDNSEPVC